MLVLMMNEQHPTHNITNDPSEELVRAWEFIHRDIKLPPRIREIALLAASLHTLEKRGITVSDLVRSGDNKDNAEKKIQDAMRFRIASSSSNY